MAYGPFQNTNVSIFCDESRHEGQSQQRFMVIGGLWLPRDNRREILEGLHRIQADHRIRGELKWGSVSRSRLPGYLALVDYLAARNDIHFRCIVVDKTKVDEDKYFRNDRQLGFWVFYWHCLKQWMGNNNTYFVSIDFKPEGLYSGPTRLRDVLHNTLVGRAWLKSLECVDSRENLFCQISDVLIGAVGYEHNGLRSSEIKSAVCGHIAQKFGRADLSGSDQPNELRLNIFKIWQQQHG